MLADNHTNSRILPVIHILAVMIGDHLVDSNLTGSSSTLGSTTVHMVMVHFAMPACFLFQIMLVGQFLISLLQSHLNYGCQIPKNEWTCYFRLSCDVSYQNGRFQV